MNAIESIKACVPIAEFDPLIPQMPKAGSIGCPASIPYDLGKPYDYREQIIQALPGMLLGASYVVAPESIRRSTIAEALQDRPALILAHPRDFAGFRCDWMRINEGKITFAPNQNSMRPNQVGSVRDSATGTETLVYVHTGHDRSWEGGYCLALKSIRYSFVVDEPNEQGNVFARVGLEVE